MTKFKIIVEYDGTTFAGWQSQGSASKPTVQDSLEKAIHDFTGETVECYGCGRTDAGVHALAMPAHFEIAAKRTAHEVLMGLNFFLDKRKLPISIIKATKAKPDFHARFSCAQRSYVYRILNRPSKPALDKARAWWVHKKLDAKAMDKAAQALVGKHDFSSFRAAGCQSASPLKTLDSISVKRKGEEIVVKVSAKSFLYHQVRNIVGTLKLVGAGEISEQDFKAILEAKDRTKAGQTAPAQGLYFEKAKY